MIISAALAAAYILTYKGKITLDRRLFEHASLLTTTLVAYYLYIFLTTFIFSKTTSVDYFKEIVSTLSLCICYFLFLTNAHLNNKFYNLLSATLCLLGWSSLATYVLMLFIPDSALKISTIDVEGYSKNDIDLGTGVILFPFTMLYGKFTTSDFYLLRVAGYFREAGIYQAISCFFLLYEFFQRKRIWVMAGLFIGAVFALSTMGLISLSLVLGIIGYYSLKNRLSRILLLTAMVTFIYPAFMYTPHIGYAAKENTHGASFSDRSQSMARGVEAVTNNPLGYGVPSFTIENAGINMIAAMGSIGIFGFLLQSFIFSGISTRKNWQRLAIFSPIFLTALVAQPLIGSPLIYILGLAALNTKTNSQARLPIKPKPPQRPLKSRTTLLSKYRPRLPKYQF